MRHNILECLFFCGRLSKFDDSMSFSNWAYFIALRRTFCLRNLTILFTTAQICSLDFRAFKTDFSKKIFFSDDNYYLRKQVKLSYMELRDSRYDMMILIRVIIKLNLIEKKNSKEQLTSLWTSIKSNVLVCGINKTNDLKTDYF